MKIIFNNILALKYYFSTYFAIIVLIISISACAERDKKNPFDPANPKSTAPVNLWITSTNNRVLLTWDSPQVRDIEGFVVYRQSEQDTAFKKIAGPLLASRRDFTDFYVDYRKRYHYYITILGQQGLESKPSEIVSIVPGPGFNWVIDRHGFRLYKFTYDLEHVIFRLDTPYYPEDVAVIKSADIGLITFPAFRVIQTFNLSTGNWVEQYDRISYPYKLAVDINSFWILDSTGAVFRMDAISSSIQLAYSELLSPTSIAIDTLSGTIYITDAGLRQIVLLNRAGQVIKTVSSTVQGQLRHPENIAVDNLNSALWLVDHTENKDYIFKGPLDGTGFTVVDSIKNAGAISVNPLDGSVWVTSLEGAESKIVQLSASGIRQRELSEFYYPWDIKINPYDGTLIVADTGNYRTLHYDYQFEVFGEYQRFVLPTKVFIE